jgi:hypothetical protein
MLVYFAVPAGALRDGDNTLRIQPPQARGTPSPDDVRVGQLVLYPSTVESVLGAGHVDVEVVDRDSGERLPSRLTIVDRAGSLQSVGTASNGHLAVRPGTVYTATGQARFGLPAGTYTLYAGRGFEYSLASSAVELAAGQIVAVRLAISREVPTDGYVACDTHVHSLTHSGHGDATVQERMITLAAEGIELPIATDHNVHIDHEPFAREMNVRRHFTPVMGNEVTTPVGHFNVFPVERGAPTPAYRLTEWQAILDGIYRTRNVKVAILNHARDIHSGVRPFGPKLFNDVVGESLAGWAMRFNAMEVLNSSATQHDVLRLFQDWMALLNRGLQVTPVGSSDSHDVLRHFVGQGRTYIRADDRDPAQIDVDMVVQNFVQGRVMVSYGLLAQLTVAGKYGSGELAQLAGDEVAVSARVLGPHWVDAERVILYANGHPVREAMVSAGSGQELPPGVKWRGTWMLPRPDHDVHLVAIAIGPGIDEPYWRTAKPYQRLSPEWEPHVVGCSGAVWLDADGDGRRSSAYDYARAAAAASGGELQALLDQLSGYDRAVAAQAAHLYQASGKSLLAADVQQLLARAQSEVQSGFNDYLAAWRAGQQAQSEP